MADYLNKTIGHGVIEKMQVPPEPEKSVIHDSTQHKWFYRSVEERAIIERAEPTGRLPLEPGDATIMLKFSGKSIPEIVLVDRPLKPEGHEVLVVANGKRVLDKVIDGAWTSRSAGPSKNLPEGSYDLTAAERPAKSASSKSFEGLYCTPIKSMCISYRIIKEKKRASYGMTWHFLKVRPRLVRR